ncbi:MAG: SPOR domain-containing protein [Leptonema sp. (in: bacteria)]
MKNRIFYVIHLDTERILFLAFLFFLFIFISFFFGFKLGKSKNQNLGESFNIPSPEKISQMEKQKENLSIQENIGNKEETNDSVKNQKINTIPIEELEKSENYKKLEVTLKDPEEENKKIIDKKETLISKQKNTYTVQIGAYKNKEEANQIVSKLKNSGIDGYIQKKKNLYVVYSNAKSLQEAKNIKKDLEKFNIQDAMIFKNK